MRFHFFENALAGERATETESVTRRERERRGERRAKERMVRRRSPCTSHFVLLFVVALALALPHRSLQAKKHVNSADGNNLEESMTGVWESNERGYVSIRLLNEFTSRESEGEGEGGRGRLIDDGRVVLS